MILYFAAFFMGFSFLMVLPSLIEGARTLAPGPEELEPAELARASEMVQERLRGKLPWAFVLAIGSVGVLTWYERLPGMRGSR